MGRQVHACLDRSAVGVAWAEGDAFGRHLDRDVVIGVGEDRDAGGARREGGGAGAGGGAGGKGRGQGGGRPPRRAAGGVVQRRAATAGDDVGQVPLGRG